MKNYFTLTEREKEVKKLVLKGLSYKEIANTLIVTEHTAKAHVCSVLHKLGLKNRYELFTHEILKLKSALILNIDIDSVFQKIREVRNDRKRFF